MRKDGRCMCGNAGPQLPGISCTLVSIIPLHVASLEISRPPLHCVQIGCRDCGGQHREEGQPTPHDTQGGRPHACASRHVAHSRPTPGVWIGGRVRTKPLCERCATKGTGIGHTPVRVLMSRTLDLPQVCAGGFGKCALAVCFEVEETAPNPREWSCLAPGARARG